MSKDYERGVEQASAIYKEVIREYVTENTKLRELLMMAYKAATEPDCADCYNEYSCKNNALSYCVMWSELEQKMRDELGIEVGQ